MYKKILVSFDGSEGSRKALRAAVEMSAIFKSELHSICVEVDLPHYVATIGEIAEVKLQKDAYFQKLNEEAEDLADEAGINLTTHITAGHAVDSIVDLATDGGFDLVIVGFTGHSRIFERIWGGTSRNIARFSPCAVLIVK